MKEMIILISRFADENYHKYEAGPEIRNIMDNNIAKSLVSAYEAWRDFCGHPRLDGWKDAEFYTHKGDEDVIKYWYYSTKPEIERVDNTTIRWCPQCNYHGSLRDVSIYDMLAHDFIPRNYCPNCRSNREGPRIIDSDSDSDFADCDEDEYYDCE